MTDNSNGKSRFDSPIINPPWESILRVSFAIVIAFSLVVGGTACAFSQVRYIVTDLGAVTGKSSLIACGLNVQGQVVGQFQSSSGPHAFLYSFGTFTDIGTLTGGTSSYASGINNNGQVVGYWISYPNTYAFLYSNGIVSDLGNLGGTYNGGVLSYASAINNGGEVVGGSRGTNTDLYINAFLWSGGVMRPLGALVTGGYSEAKAINDGGQIAGNANTTNTDRIAFLYSGGAMQNLGALPHDGESVASGINNAGQVVGTSYESGTDGNLDEHAFLYSGSMMDLGNLGGNGFSQSKAINNNGQVVGSAYATNGERAFLYDGHTMLDLNDLVPTNYSNTLVEAVAINDNGQILVDGGTGSLLLTPFSAFSITSHRLSPQQANMSSLDPIDAPIVPFPDSNILATATAALGLGVVADEVTPVLLEISGLSGAYFISISNNAASYRGVLATNIFVLEGSEWEQTTNITVFSSNHTGIAFAYIQGLNWTNFIGPPGQQEVALTVFVESATNPATTVSTTFKVRPPPIALVHGYNADSTTWGSHFLAVLTNARPADFVFTAVPQG